MNKAYTFRRWGLYKRPTCSPYLLSVMGQTHSLSVFRPLFRSKEIEATGCNGDAAFLAVRVQQVVIEFILNHVDQIFNNGTPGSLENNGNGSVWQTRHQAILLPCLSHGTQ